MLGLPETRNDAGEDAMRRVRVAIVAGLLMTLGSAWSWPIHAEGRPPDVTARLTGFQETPSVSTRARGRFEAWIEADHVYFKLSYDLLEAPVTVAHIHFGQRHTAGGVSAFFCGGGGKPACPPAGTVTGTIAAADVLGPAAQGIAPGELNELIRAIRAGATYANVHSEKFPAGEIRGQIVRAQSPLDQEDGLGD
jgi:hypothetical protein